MTNRYPGTEALLSYFSYAHLPEHLQAVSRPFHDLAAGLVEAYPDGPELTVGLRKLLEAKDCVVRHALTTRNLAKLAGEAPR